ncbi:MAG TPA: hypothetical protein DHV36_21710 [Desulfobacteraceae bacterium]|nr:hypothetical protein [Desulfobacteraceae bacterium]
MQKFKATITVEFDNTHDLKIGKMPSPAEFEVLIKEGEKGEIQYCDISHEVYRLIGKNGKREVWEPALDFPPELNPDMKFFSHNLSKLFHGRCTLPWQSRHRRLVRRGRESIKNNEAKNGTSFWNGSRTGSMEKM